MLEKLQSGNFAPYLNQTFGLQAASQECLQIELIDVTQLGRASDEEMTPRQPFSIVFRAPEDSFLPQSIYTVEHPELGRLDLFLVPIGPDRQGMRYEAVFS